MLDLIWHIGQSDVHFGHAKISLVWPDMMYHVPYFLLICAKHHICFDGFVLDKDACQTDFCTGCIAFCNRY